MKTVSVGVTDKETLLVVRFVQVLRGIHRSNYIYPEMLARVLAYLARRHGCEAHLRKELGQ